MDVNFVSRTLVFAALAGSVVAFGYAEAQQQPAKSAAATYRPIGTSGAETITGFSWNKQGLNRTVINDAGEEIGKGIDVLLGPDITISHIVVQSGGKMVAVPVSKLGHAGNSFILRGFSKDALKAAPEFKYAAN